MSCTRPDICYVASKLLQYLSKPKVVHLNMSKQVLRYLTRRSSQGVFLQKTRRIIGFSDAGWANSDERKSKSGFTFQLGDGGTLISWKSEKQATVALSSCESEYTAMSFAVQGLKFLYLLLWDMFGATSTTILYAANQCAVSLAKNSVNQQTSWFVGS